MLNTQLRYAWRVQSHMYDWFDWIKNWSELNYTDVEWTLDN